MSETGNTIRFLGQSGFLVSSDRGSILFDPYLSDSVERLYGGDFKRISRPPVAPEDLGRVDFILISHSHQDHCDCDSLGPILNRNGEAKVFAPENCKEVLLGAGFPAHRIHVWTNTEWMHLNQFVSVKPVPACHPTIEADQNGVPKALGYLVKFGSFTIYHAGDTSPHETIIHTVAAERPHLALLPINERNYFKAKKGIIGNMSCREALEFSTNIKAGRWVPMHWDVFRDNCVNPQELNLLIKGSVEERRVCWMKAGESLSISGIVGNEL